MSFCCFRILSGTPRGTELLCLLGLSQCVTGPQTLLLSRDLGTCEEYESGVLENAPRFGLVQRSLMTRVRLTIFGKNTIEMTLGPSQLIIPRSL